MTNTRYLAVSQIIWKKLVITTAEYEIRKISEYRPKIHVLFFYYILDYYVTTAYIYGCTYQAVLIWF